MLEYDGIEVSEGINVSKSNASNKGDICYYWHFLDKDFKQEPHHRNGYLDLMQKPMNFNDVAIVSVKGNDYRIHFQ